MADLKIKPSAGTGNRLLLQSSDGTDVLTTSDSGVAITAPTIASMANCTFPTGHIINSGQFLYSGGDSSVDESFASPYFEAAVDYSAITCVVGNTILFGFNGSCHVSRTGNTHLYRYGDFRVFQSTTDVTKGTNTGSLGTEVTNFSVGANLVATSSVAAVQMHQFDIGGSFISTATTHYLGMGFSAIEAVATSGDVTLTLNQHAAKPLLLYWFEIKGNVKGTG